VITSELVEFRPLDRAAAEDLLLSGTVGRLAYARQGQVDIEPVSYVFARGWLWGRTSVGTKWHLLADTAYRWWPVAFEVDEMTGPHRWRSVVVKGGFHALDPPSTGGDPALWEEAVRHLRTREPEAFTEQDPVAGRDRLFRIAVQEITGREAVPPAFQPDGPVPVTRRV
jgi:uncharacterized protein